MEPLRNDTYTDPSAELVAALALGLAVSWRDPREQVAELRAATDAAHAVAARTLLTGSPAPDPRTTARAVDLLSAAFPSAPPSSRPATVMHPRAGDTATGHPAVGA